jgi:hypothetical protein
MGSSRRFKGLLPSLRQTIAPAAESTQHHSSGRFASQARFPPIHVRKTVKTDNNFRRLPGCCAKLRICERNRAARQEKGKHPIARAGTGLRGCAAARVRGCAGAVKCR